MLVSGDDDLLALGGVATAPIMTAREYLLAVGSTRRSGSARAQSLRVAIFV